MRIIIEEIGNDDRSREIHTSFVSVKGDFQRNIGIQDLLNEASRKFPAQVPHFQKHPSVS